jgi:REP element-mobilizing transposase RayT
MPRSARLDKPGILRHVIIRGIERRRIFRDDADREDMLDRLADLLPETNTACYAWAFLDNHAHFLFRSGPRGRRDAGHSISLLSRTFLNLIISDS